MDAGWDAARHRGEPSRPEQYPGDGERADQHPGRQRPSRRGSKLVSTYAYQTDAILITGNQGVDTGQPGPLNTFFNNAGPDALQVTDTSQGARWIIWARDVTDAEAFLPGGLAHDFTLHAAQDNGAWNLYAGNGYISYNTQTAYAYGGAVTRDYDGTRNAELSYFQVYSTPGGTTRHAGRPVLRDLRHQGRRLRQVAQHRPRRHHLQRQQQQAGLRHRGAGQPLRGDHAGAGDGHAGRRRPHLRHHGQRPRSAPSTAASCSAKA